MKITQRKCRQRHGTTLVLLVISIGALFAMIALAIDIGILAMARSEAQNAADAGALAGVREINGDSDNDNNSAAVEPAVLATTSENTILSRAIPDENVETEIGTYTYDSDAGKFVVGFPEVKPDDENWGAVRVTVSDTHNTAFARVLSIDTLSVVAKATGIHRPRDIAIVLDFSVSMRFSSIFAHPYSGSYDGGLNADSRIPRFGHWSPTSMQDLMYRSEAFIRDNGEVLAPSNFTIETDNGPAIVDDFFMEDSNGELIPAFNRSGVPYVPDVAATPAPDDFDIQSDDTENYVGDKWPRVSNDVNEDYAKTVQEYLQGNNTVQSDTHEKDATFESEGYGENFVGYSMGPGYYGKTFYIWPPDPRPEFDWRKKFFTYHNSSDAMDDNSHLWESNGNWRQAGSDDSYDINYTEVIQWIKSGPNVFPPNLRAGRLVYYDSIPDSIPDSGGTLDEKFWRAYIDHVIGAGSTNRSLFGSPNYQWGTTRITAKSSLNSEADDRPYMHYNDNPRRPKAHFWFGPLTMLGFIAQNNNRNMLPGTCHESQTWQLKAGINSAITDIKKNHPNDWACLIYFSSRSDFKDPRVEMGKEWQKMKDALFFPYSLLNSLDDPESYIRPYNNNIQGNSAGNVPVAVGGTGPDMGFKVAYNEFAKGRKGAGKVVIFQTDGVPNRVADSNFSNGGPYNSEYTDLGDFTFYGNNDPTVISTTLGTVDRLVAREDNNLPGYSTKRIPVYVHAIAFGDLFENDTDSSSDAMDFLVQVEQHGNTSPDSADSIPDFKIIIGNFDDRTESLREAIERIMQSGIQVSLLE